MWAFSPNGSPITGTLEKMTGTALTSCDGFERAPDGKLEYHHIGQTDVDWDSQETDTKDGEPLFVDEDGNSWKASQLILCETEEFEDPAEAARAAANEAEAGNVEPA